MSIGLLTMLLYLPGCNSLKEKRSHIRPILARLHREFNISAAEVGDLDSWRQAVIACVIVSNENAYNQSTLQAVLGFTQNNWPDVEIYEHHIESV